MAEDPDILVDLTTAQTEFEANIIVEALRAQGIECEAFTTAGAVLQWDVAATQPMRIQVRRKDLANAAATLKAIRAESVDIDWDEVDVGDAKTLAAAERAVMKTPDRCERCGEAWPAGAEKCPKCGWRPADAAPEPSRGLMWVILGVGAAAVAAVLAVFGRSQR